VNYAVRVALAAAAACVALAACGRSERPVQPLLSATAVGEIAGRCGIEPSVIEVDRERIIVHVRRLSGAGQQCVFREVRRKLPRAPIFTMKPAPQDS
jgi:hypothetical protein